MDEILRQRFAALDRIAAPDISTEVERRTQRLASAAAAGSSARRRVDGLPHELFPLRRTQLLGRPGLVVLVALLLLALVGVLIIGPSAFWPQRSVFDPYSTQAPDFATPERDCIGVAPYALRTASHAWDAGPRPGWFTSPTPGTIQAFWRESRPNDTVVHLLDYDLATRESCYLVTDVEAEVAAPLEDAGWIRHAQWSPNGGALAIVSNESLGVWSSRGYVNVSTFEEIADDGTGLGYQGLSWSSDGSMLAVGFGGQIVDWFDPKPSEVWLYRADGSAPRRVTFDGCDPCVVARGPFSPDNTRLALASWDVEGDERGDELIAIANADDLHARVLDTGVDIDQIVGWLDNDTVLAIDANRRLVAIPVARPRDLSVVFQLPIDEEAVDFELSPDLSKVHFRRHVEVPTADPNGDPNWVDLWVIDLESGFSRRVAHERMFWGHVVWSPDSRLITYAVHRDERDWNRGHDLKVVDVYEGEPVPVAFFISPAAWRPVWR